jgi:hypothetical protein
MEEEKKENESSISDWLKDNLRIIVSVAIVVAIAGGIYSYSKRTQPPTTTKEQSVAGETTESNKEGAVEVGGTNQAATEGKTETKKETPQVSPQASSKETETSFVESAGRGDGVTRLARRALANYLEKNPDSSLTAEHKIYIEDYLRKHAGFKGRVHIGTSVEFNKDLISQAINQSKKLSDKQIKNLHKYVVRVPSLS